MSFDGIAEQEAILERAKQLVGGRIHDGLTDDLTLERDQDGSIKPYIVVWFGEMYDQTTDRSLTGEEQQPVIMPMIFECWAPTATICREVAGKLRPLFRGWAANENMSPIRFRGAGNFMQRDSAGLPSRFQRTVSMETILNMSVQTESA